MSKREKIEEKAFIEGEHMFRESQILEQTFTGATCISFILANHFIFIFVENNFKFL